jgi:hypothetical protein
MRTNIETTTIRANLYSSQSLHLLGSITGLAVVTDQGTSRAEALFRFRAVSEPLCSEEHHSRLVIDG